MLEETILIIYKKIENYNPDYHDQQGNPNPVKFVFYIWKRINGFIVDYLKKEMNKPTVPYDDGAVLKRKEGGAANRINDE